MNSSHPACSGRLLKPENFDAMKDHPACIFVWDYEQQLKDQAGLIEVSDTEYEDEEAAPNVEDSSVVSEILENPKLTKYHHALFFAAHLKNLPVQYVDVSFSRRMRHSAP